ncbi:MAG: hypothetical protein JWQ81_8363 [Amycolatopsis sp.]|uniref:SWIM zinc finger family protein n=1 Tax=Amycolatopsis sp. TaxID=37632 RepID=UPI002614FDB7|nr:SWIM zinc finger family protein [Amycolatopsis sp.]MCU1687624.1 hypothetical protein [Amycolatopsis sp.]
MTRGFYPPAKPRLAADGIKARSKRGAIAQTWWSNRFIGVLESIGVGGRLQRGRNYARAGQVTELKVQAGSVTARVQGTSPRPYGVRIKVKVFGKTKWAEVEHALAERAWYTAKLLAGEMPEDIEDVFAAVGLSLFPGDFRDLQMDCSCPDYEVPCKHLAAVCYLLAEQFDDDPFTILGWRGRSRDDLLGNLQAIRDAGVPASDRESHESLVTPLTECLDRYFQPAGTLVLPARPPAHGAALLTQVPEVDVTVRGKPLLDLLRPWYEDAQDWPPRPGGATPGR